MKRSEFHKHITQSVLKALPELSKSKGYLNINSELGNAINVPILKNPENDPKISRSLINHFDKLIELLKNTSNKKLSTPCALCGSEYLKPLDQQFEVYKALVKFLKIAINRDKHGIRNAFISFTRQRKQKLVKSE